MLWTLLEEEGEGGGGGVKGGEGEGVGEGWEGLGEEGGGFNFLFEYFAIHFFTSILFISILG